MMSQLQPIRYGMISVIDDDDDDDDDVAWMMD